MTKMQPPGQLALSFLNQWMKSPDMGTVYLTGHDKHLWTSTEPHELLALDRREHDNLLSSWMTKVVRKWLHPAIGRHFKVIIPGEKNAVEWPPDMESTEG